MGNSYLGALLAIIAFGSYMVPLRRYPNFSSYASLVGVSYGVLAVSLGLAFFTNTLAINGVGLLCGLLWVVGGSLCFSAVHNEKDLSGTSVRMMGACVLFSFLSGAILLKEKIEFLFVVPAFLSIGGGLFLLSPKMGMLYKRWRSICAGIIFGIHLLPFQMSDLTEMEFAFSYAIGIFVAANLLFFVRRSKEHAPLNPKSPWVISFLAGILWLAGTHGSFWAIDSNGPLGFAIGYPLTQLNLLVNIAWGVFVFKEYPTKKERLRLVLAAIVLLIGAVLLTLSKVFVEV